MRGRRLPVNGTRFVSAGPQEHGGALVKIRSMRDECRSVAPLAVIGYVPTRWRCCEVARATACPNSMRCLIPKPYNWRSKQVAHRTCFCLRRVVRARRPRVPLTREASLHQLRLRSMVYCAWRSEVADVLVQGSGWLRIPVTSRVRAVTRDRHPLTLSCLRRNRKAP